jgi:hypothetical protein
MVRPHIRDDARVATRVPGGSCRRYVVLSRKGEWFITFDDEEFGPYQSGREATLFAVDAAHSLGEQGEDTCVFRLDEGGEASPVWTYGLDPYPPNQ